LAFNATFAAVLRKSRLKSSKKSIYNLAYMTKQSFFYTLLFSIFIVCAAQAQHDQPADHATAQQGATTAHEGDKKFDATEMILNHIGNSNEFHLFGNYYLPLPCIVYSKEDGVKTFLSNVFHNEKMYAKAYDGYVSDHGATRRVIDDNFPKGSVALEGETHGEETHYIHHEKRGDEEVGFVKVGGKEYELEKSSGLFAHTSFYDFSISKNVFTMLMACTFLLVLFGGMASAYKKNKNGAPKGWLHNMLETMVQFITDEVAKPMIGEKYMRFLPLLLTIFFFILTCNIFGLIPLAPFGANVTGNIATTAALALVAFLVTNLNGNANYWGHIFWMPGVPVAMKLFLAPIELLGVFTKPISLMIRLFANITAGHIIVLALVGLIFVFGNAGESMMGATAGTFLAVPFTLFLSVIELIVAFIQAFIFTILVASYIGGAIEEHHHEAAH
jgi:F-type H+-transporting ATPase subunit a